MTPSPQERASKVFNRNEDKDRVVISGMSGVFPKSKHIKDLADVLYNKVNPIEKDTRRWDYVHPELVKFMGKIPNVDRFDSQFFKVNSHVVYTMDTMSRKLLEQAYQAIFDAGLSPEHLQGKNIGVYIGSSYSETDKASFQKDLKNGISGTSRAMFANRISYWLNVKGPSMSLDQSCCSSMMALEEAYNAIKRGEIEAALVGASNLCLHPQALIHYGRIIKLSEDGKVKSFDANANGCLKSDALSVIFLQKAQDALRVYASVVHVKSEFNSILSNESGPVYGFYRDPAKLSDYLKVFYKEAGLSPEVVEYVEAFGTGIPEIDETELKVIDEVFCGNRSDTLPIGSVMSNVGYTESASGLLSITKVLLAYQTGQLAATLHYENPRQDVPAIRDGKIRVVSENEPFVRSYVAVNNFSVNGNNAHILLNGEYKAKQLEKYNSKIPRLIIASGRQEYAVQTIFDDLKKRPIDLEEIALLHNIHEKKINGHLSRGYAIFDTKEDKTVCLDEKVEHFDGTKRPVWFVYSGMGSQWTGMGRDLMRIPKFAATMQRIQKALSPKGLDIIDIITTSDKTVLNNILNTFLGISSIQIALTDVLNEMGIVPDNIIGHSLGELGCAYGDGCFTVEEMILSSYYRGRVCIDIPVVKGAMAAVGLGYKQIRDICPTEIVVACHNGPDSCTISGPVEDIKIFIEKLKADGIFVKAVATGDFAFHSPYVAAFGKTHHRYLKEIITPRERSDRWISTSAPTETWNEPAVKYSCAEYHNNNMMNPVLFEERLQLIPSNAVLIEIAPHGILQPILKRSTPPSCRNIALTRRDQPDNVDYFLNSIGQLYLEGLNPKIANLYPKIEFPVSTETPSLSHLVEWIHDENWELALFDCGEKKIATSSKFLITLHENEYQYLRGCVVRGKTVFPFAAALVAIWDVMSVAYQLPKKQSVQFRDLQFFSQPILHEQRQIRLTMSLHRGSGQFEISDDVTKVAAGYIYSEMPELKGVFKENVKEQHVLDLNSEDIYTLLQDRDYSYSGDFRSIHKANLSLNEALLVWQDNWATIIDGILQLNILRQRRDTGCQPVYIRRLCIDVKEHKNSQANLCDLKVIRTTLNDVHDFTRCGGILLENIQYHNLPPVTRENFTINPLKNLKNIEEHTANSFRTTFRSTSVGDIKSMHLVTEYENNEPGIKVQVHYAGVNEYDMRKLTGTVPAKYGCTIGYGMDFSGKTKSGQNVMGVIKEGALSSSVLAQPELLWNVPTDWTLEDAATVPLAYCLAFYCLKIKTTVTPGMNIFILGGAGAMGQAAISIALAHGCRVFTAVSNNHKKQLLLKLFSGLNENDIGTSHDASFKKMIVIGTNGRGCDIVISNAVGNLKDVALSCCAPSGITIDTALAVSKERFSFGLLYLKNRRIYISVDFSSIFTHNNTEDMKVLHDLVNEGIKSGYVRPLTRIVYDPSDVALAFKCLEERQNCGRLLVRLDGVTPKGCRYNPITSESCYLILCEDAFGLKVADRLVTRGLKKLRLYYPKVTGHLQFKLQYWNKLGVHVEISSGDLRNHKSSQTLFGNGKFGHLDGIYIIATNKKSFLLNKSILNYLDIESRKLCSQLKYFIIVNNDASISQSIILSRVQNNLPAVELILPYLEKADDDNSSSLKTISWQDAIEAVTAVISYSSGSFIVEPKESPSLLKQVSSITDIDIITSDKTLEDLGLINCKAELLRIFFQDMYNVSLDDEQIRRLTAKSIQDIEDTLVWTGFNKTEGLKDFFSYVDTDELRANTTMVMMQTRAHTLDIDDFDVDKTYLYIVPGLEGLHGRFRLLCERLKLPALVLQPGFNHAQENIQEQARRFVEILLNKMKLKTDFYLMGYESGVLIALEMISILEEKGLIGTIFFIGIPHEIQDNIQEYQKDLNTEEKLHDEVIKTIADTVIEDTSELELNLAKCHTLDEKIETAAQTIMILKGITNQYTSAVLKTAIARIKAVEAYKLQSGQFNSKLIMLCANSTISQNSTRNYSKQPVDIYHLGTPLTHLPRDLRCATIINQHLSSDLLKAYENKNICETYHCNNNTLVFGKCPE